MRDIYALDAEEQKAHEVKFGGYNDFPPGWREITMAEFSNSQYFNEVAQMTEYRQMFLKDGERIAGPCVSATLYFYHGGTGVAMVSDHKSLVQFFAFGCAHQYREMSDDECREKKIHLYRCMHAYICSKCNHVSITDSSD